MKELVLGAVAYDAKVVPIWEGFRTYFVSHGLPFDFVLYSNYERQVEQLLGGHIDLAWDTPLAHVRVQRRTDGRSLSLGMRDSDRDFHAKVVVRRDAGIRALRDLEGRTLAVGSRDSTQARILPLHFLRQEGVDLDRVRLLAFDTDLGKHGDTGASDNASRAPPSRTYARHARLETGATPSSTPVSRAASTASPGKVA